jgi:hypothetical protein
MKWNQNENVIIVDGEWNWSNWMEYGRQNFEW